MIFTTCRHTLSRSLKCVASKVVGLICDVPNLLHILYYNLWNERKKKCHNSCTNHRLHILLCELLLPPNNDGKNGIAEMGFIVCCLPVQFLFLHNLLLLWILLDIYNCVHACVHVCERTANVEKRSDDPSKRYYTSDSALPGPDNRCQTKPNQTIPDISYAWMHVYLCWSASSSISRSCWLLRRRSYYLVRFTCLWNRQHFNELIIRYKFHGLWKMYVKRNNKAS